jgi:coupling of ubiquitin conjugation to ER degradation protein 1
MLPQAVMPAPGRAATALKKTEPDLIQRYNLADRLSEGDAGAGAGEEAAKAAEWSSSKTERQTALQKRREEMILAARRKMLEKN